MVHVILMVRLTRSDEAKRAVRLRCGQKAHLARRVARNHQQKERAAAGALDLDAEALVGLFVNQRVRLPRTGHVAIEPVSALRRRVFNGIKKRAVVRRPSRAGHALHRFGKLSAAPQILDVQRVLPESSGVQRVGKKLVVVANVECPESEKRVALRQYDSGPKASRPVNRPCPRGGNEIGYCLPSSVHVK